MAIKLNFDTAGQIESPTFVLAKRDGHKLKPIINIEDLVFEDSFGNPSEFCFRITKGICDAWSMIRNFRLLWVKEWDSWYEVKVEINEENKSTKFITATHLPESELVNLNLYGVEINTDADIDRADYIKPSVLFDIETPEASTLHRITKEATNFVIGYVDVSIAKIQKTFSFDKISLYDAMLEIAKEYHCYFSFKSYTKDKKIIREISVYDLENYCNACGSRFEYGKVCPKCGSLDIRHGYGEDTSVFLSLENALDSVDYTTDVDSVKNWFKLEAGDDLMTDTIRGCNPNGSNYISYISDELKEEMSEELRGKIEEYDKLYDEYFYNKEYSVNVTSYNNLVYKYQSTPFNNAEITTTEVPIKGYQALMNAMYDAIDMETYLRSELLPSFEMDKEYSAISEMEKLVSDLTSISIYGTAITESTVTNAVKSMAKAIIMSGYEIKISEESLNGTTWIGKFTITNYSDGEDTSESDVVTVAVKTNDYEQFVYEKIQKVLAKGDDDNYGITALFDLDITLFKEEIRKYGLDSLLMLQSCCDGVIGVLAEQGLLNKDNYDQLALDQGANEHLYNKISLPYLEQQSAINDEIKIREEEIVVVTKLQDNISVLRTEIQNALDFERYIGEELWSEFVSFRRDDVYSNSNYISDGLTNDEIFKQANEFLEAAMKEIKRAATPQHSISVSMKNILTLKEFEPMRKMFNIGNWIRVEVDGSIYKLRLLSYEIDFENLESISVTFSDVEKIGNDISDIRDVLNNAQSISKSYNSVKRQASKGEESAKVQDGWFEDGMEATLVNIVNTADGQTQHWDRYGMLLRMYNDFTEDYDPRQTKIINSTIAMTSDNWKTTKAALGLFHYVDPVTGELKEAWGINGETVIGKLILGEQMGLYNSDASMRFDKNGLYITNKDNSKVVSINPNDSSLFKIQSKINGTLTNVIYFNDSGNACFKGSVYADNGYFIGTVKATDGEFTGIVRTSEGNLGGWVISAAGISKTSGNNTVYVLDGTNANKDFLVVQVKDASGNYTYPFWVHADGAMSATNAIISGSITATTLTATQSGTIACWNFNNTAIYRGNSTFNTSGGMYFGTSGLSISNLFSVTSSGVLTATNANISGHINAGTGTIAGFTISNSWNTSDHLYAETLYSHSAFEMKLANGDAVMVDAQFGLKPIGDSENLMIYLRVKPQACTVWNATSGADDEALRLFSVTGEGKVVCHGLDVYTTDSLEQSSSIKITHASDSACVSTDENGVKLQKISRIRPDQDNTRTLGSSNLRWSTVWSVNGINNASDRNQKKNIVNLTDVHKQFFMKLIPVSFMYIFPNSDRTHIGFIAQDVEDAMSECGLSDLDFAGFCKDVKQERKVVNGCITNEMEDVYDENGNPVYIYSLRYTEFIGIITYVLQDTVNRVDKLYELIGQSA